MIAAEIIRGEGARGESGDSTHLLDHYGNSCQDQDFHIILQ